MVRAAGVKLGALRIRIPSGASGTLLVGIALAFIATEWMRELDGIHKGQMGRAPL